MHISCFKMSTFLIAIHVGEPWAGRPLLFIYPKRLPKCRRNGIGLRVLILPELRKTIRRKRSVSGRRLQIAVPEIVRQRLSVVPIVGELVSGRVSKHVRMDLKGKPR